MDYEIKPTSRRDLRLYAKFFRTICSFSEDEPIDPIQLLDRIPDLEGFEDIGSADPAVFTHFCEIIDENVTIENSFLLAKKYIAELKDCSISNAFGSISEEEWADSVCEYLSNEHKGQRKE